MFLLLVAFACNSSSAQDHEARGADFRQALKYTYYECADLRPLTYAEARKYMFAYSSNISDSIECIYSGLRQAHERGMELTHPQPFNTEHVVPQSVFDKREPMRSDMHILWPCLEKWNGRRSNYAFRELDDSIETRGWIRLEDELKDVPGQDRDTYTEYAPGGWEPRESIKGEMARAHMYFFTMYPQYELSAWIDTSVLCKWHLQDPVDAKELFRNRQIDSFQGNWNPFVTYPWLAGPAWGCSVDPPFLDDAVHQDGQLAARMNFSAQDREQEGMLELPDGDLMVLTPEGSLLATGIPKAGGIILKPEVSGQLVILALKGSDGNCTAYDWWRVSTDTLTAPND